MSRLSTLLAALAFVLAGTLARAQSPHTQKNMPQDVDWQTSPLDLDLRGMNGEHYEFSCPPGKPQPSRVAGSGPYTDDSSICSAAVHAGAIHAKDGGAVAIEIRPGEPSYRGTEQNYIKSGDFGPWSGSFLILRDARAAAK